MATNEVRCAAVDGARGRVWAALGLVLAAACFSGEATLGALCVEDADCGAEQICSNRVCGYCGDGVAQPGEVCLEADGAIEIAGMPLRMRPQDLDRNGSLDLVVHVPGAMDLTVLRGEADGFSSPETVALPFAADHLALGDLDADDTVDALVANAEGIHFGGGSGVLAFSFGSEVIAWMGTTGLEFAPPSDSSAAFGIATRPAEDGQTEVAAIEIGPGGQVQLGAAVLLPGAARPVAVGEVANAGAPEVALAYGPTIVLRSGSDLEPLAEVVLEADVVAVALVDLDGDGNRDVLASDAAGTVVVHEGDGVGGFSRGAAFEVDAAATAMVVGDLNRDGRRDVAVATAEGVRLALARGVRFPETIAVPGPSAAADILITDLGDDRLPDLIVTSATAGQVVRVGVAP